MGKSTKGFDELNHRIITCSRCPRLREYCKAVAANKRRQFLDWDYWERPLPGFGDHGARVLVVGLAPAAHGGTRTGRIFCGDSSGDWLVRALFETGFANQYASVSRFDGLRLQDVYLTAIVRCAPPQNRPSPRETANCLPYLIRELELLPNLTDVVVLGRFAFENFLRAAEKHYGLKVKPKPIFRHGAIYNLGSGIPKLHVSYHPSRQNTQTGMLSWRRWEGVFRAVRRTLSLSQRDARMGVVNRC